MRLHNVCVDCGKNCINGLHIHKHNRILVGKYEMSVKNGWAHSITHKNMNRKTRNEKTRARPACQKSEIHALGNRVRVTNIDAKRPGVNMATRVSNVHEQVMSAYLRTQLDSGQVGGNTWQCEKGWCKR